MVDKEVKGMRISIHAPRVGSDQLFKCFEDSPAYFNPRSPCGERHVNRRFIFINSVDFNPRSPCGERLSPSHRLPERMTFQSTLPVWGATAFCNSLPLIIDISIHAPRVGSDINPQQLQ